MTLVINERLAILLGIVIACAAYTPVCMYLFDNSLSTMLSRAYFMIGGAAVALYAKSLTEQR